MVHGVNAGKSAVIEPRKDEAATARSHAHLASLEQLPLGRWAALSHSSGHKEVSPGCSHEFHMRGTVVVNTSQEATEKAGQSRLLDHEEDPGVIDTGKSSNKVFQKIS